MQKLLVCLFLGLACASGLSAAQTPVAPPDAQKITDALGGRAKRAALRLTPVPGVNLTYADDALSGRPVCELSSHRSIPFTSADSEDRVGLGYASASSCEREGEIRLFLVLEAPKFDAPQMRYRLWISGTRNDLLGVPSLHGDSGGVERIQKRLDSMIDAPVVTGSALPAWRPGALEPDLPAPFIWISGASREQWEAVRTSDLRVWCAHVKLGEFSCWTPAERQAAALLVLEARGGAESACAFTAALAGPRKPVTCEAR